MPRKVVEHTDTIQLAGIGIGVDCRCWPTADAQISSGRAAGVGHSMPAVARLPAWGQCRSAPSPVYNCRIVAAPVCARRSCRCEHDPGENRSEIRYRVMPHKVVDIRPIRRGLLEAVYGVSDGGNALHRNVEWLLIEVQC
eukprot:jgi/Ulvmu1/10279/UM060_0081.1